MYNDYLSSTAGAPSRQLRASVGHPDELATKAARAWKAANEGDYHRLASRLMREARALPIGSKAGVSVRRCRYVLGIYYSNTLDAAMARELESDFPELEGKLSKRKSRSDGWC